MDVIKDTGRLPEWFDVDKYQVFDALGDLELLEQLEARLLMREEISSIEDELYYQSIMENPLINFEHCHAQARKSIGTNLQSEEFAYWNQRNKSEGKQLARSASDAIRPVSLFEAYFIGEQAREAMGLSGSGGIEPQHLASAKFRADFNNSLNAIASESQTLNLSINLDYSDDLILKELKQLLPKLREQMNWPAVAKGKHTPSIRDRLSEHKVIPFLDLSYWAQVEGKEIPYRVYAAALFKEAQNGEKGEEYIRKTLKPFLDKVMADGFTDDWRAKIKAVA